MDVWESEPSLLDPHLPPKYRLQLEAELRRSVRIYLRRKRKEERRLRRKQKRKKK